MSLVRRIARPLLASIFISEGIDTLRHPEARVVQAAPAVEKVSRPLGMTVDAKTAVQVNGAIMAAGGLLLAAGKVPRLAATSLGASLVATTDVVYPCGSYKDPDERRTLRNAFSLNLVFLGGLLRAAADTSGKPSLAWRRQHRKEVRAK